MHRSSPETHTSPRSAIFISLSDGLAGCPFLQNFCLPKPPAGSTELVHAPGPLDSMTLSETTNYGAMPGAGWPARTRRFPFLTKNLFDPIFGDVLGTLQTLARAAGCLTLPTPRDAFLTALTKPAFPLRGLDRLRLCCVPYLI